MWIFQRQHVSQRDQRTHALDLLQQRHLRITRLRQRFDPLVVLADPCAQFFNGRQQRLQCPLQLRTEPLRFLRIHIAYIAAAQAFAVALGQPACRVDQSGARSHQPGAPPNHHQIRLRLCAAMLHRIRNFGSMRASRASVCASSRSSFLRLSPISRTLRALATITSCPNSLSKRLIQGECVPISSAIRLRGIAPKTSCKAFAVVWTRCSNWIWPASSTTQYQLLRSPRSNPMVSFCCEIFLFCFTATVLTFFIAGLLYLLCLEHVDNLGAYTASRPGDRPSPSKTLCSGGSGLKCN